MELKRIIGQCAPLFFLAVTFDLVGFILLLVGLCASPQQGGRWYGDFLALTGALLMFFGLGMWVMWHAGNLGADGKRSGFARISRRLTERLSSVRSMANSGTTELEEQGLEQGELEQDEKELELEEKLEKKEQEEKEQEELEEKEQEEKEQEELEEKEQEEKALEQEKQELEQKEKEEDVGNGAYINEAYEPADNETV